MRGSRKFCQRGSNFGAFFSLFCLVDEGREDPNTTISWPLSARQRDPCQRWPKVEYWLCSFVIFQGIRTSIAKTRYIFVIFQVGSGLPVPLSIRARIKADTSALSAKKGLYIARMMKNEIG